MLVISTFLVLLLIWYILLTVSRGGDRLDLKLINAQNISGSLESKDAEKYLVVIQMHPSFIETPPKTIFIEFVEDTIVGMLDMEVGESLGSTFFIKRKQ
jgi:hypothetical protein